MAERVPMSFDEVGIATRDVRDVLIVAQSLLNAMSAPLPVRERDALSTVLRLGLDRAAAVDVGFIDLLGTRRG